jgi:hypothetical protein
MGIVMAVSGVMCVHLRKINTWENSGRNQQRKERKRTDKTDAKITELQPLEGK